MEITEEKVVAVILVGGPTKGTRFRPLSFNTPEPLFPLAGQPMINHPISACKREIQIDYTEYSRFSGKELDLKFVLYEIAVGLIVANSQVPNLVQIFLIGFYEEREFALYVSSISNELKVPVRYLKEDKPHGSAGSLYYFRDQIMDESPSHILLLNFDVCCNFPLPNMLEAHKRYGGMGTLLVIKKLGNFSSPISQFPKVSAESASKFGELVADPITKELLHYTEKPETFVSDLINCGIYVFTPKIFNVIHEFNHMLINRPYRSIPTGFVRLDQDILSPLAGKKQLYTYETTDFWEQIKTPGMSIECSALYLAQFRFTSPHLLSSGDGKSNATVVGDIGPNVSISANVRIASGVRLMNCIVLDDVEIKENAVVMHSIVGWKSSLGRWSRVQAEGDHNTKLGITILGEAVTVEDEVVVINSIVLPNKMLNVSVQEEIIL
ncbi:hypothetical protein ACJIZ3_007935 [Penstemon smallii]|uniref:Nucleotidyl transferase domain-containing protein n=1 Tax=Penstemon smallii TaxID=265156 RepID=A0ABD3T8D0_9LAMI